MLVAETYLWQSWLWATDWKLADVLALIVCLGIEYWEILASSTETLSSTVTFLGVGKWELGLSLVRPALLPCV